MRDNPGTAKFLAADESTRLNEITGLYNSDGVFLIEDTKTLTITQGNGKTASVLIYPSDTIGSLREKLNDAIANGLGQNKYTNNPKQFVTFVTEGSELTQGLETVPGTFLVRSAIPGMDGELYFSGDEDLLNALGLNTIQESQESKFTASVYNAHTGQTVAQNVKATESAFVSLIPPDIDISVDPMAGVSANWDDTTKRFIWARKANYEAMIHLKNNGTIFQTGANNGEDFMIDLGDMSSEALDLSGVNLLTRESASRSISLIDKTIKHQANQLPSSVQSLFQ